MKKEMIYSISCDARYFANLLLYICVSICFCTCDAHPDGLSNQTDNPVVFFKQAISAPPDVEKYALMQQSIGSNSFLCFTGARAESNYYLQQLSGSNALDASSIVSIAGRSGITEYERSPNSISFGVGSNGLTGGVGVLFTLTRQFLDMGLSEIGPESVKWNGDSFTATNGNGAFRYGELIISNGLPSRLEIGVAKGSTPYKVIDYTYPDPPLSLNGFPAKMLISGESGGTLIPQVEVQFYSVKLAAKPLSDEFFSATQFVTPRILYTNLYSNSDLYGQLRRGKTVTLEKVPDSLLKSGGYSNSRPRIVIFLGFALVTAVPIAYFIFTSKKQNKLKATYTHENKSSH